MNTFAYITMHSGMNILLLKEKIKQSPWLKQHLLHLSVHPVKARPRWWLRLLIPFYIKKGKGAVIYQSVRKDLLPNHKFVMGSHSVIEDYCAINNGVGNIIIGKNVRLGLGGTIIGPVTMEDYSFTGQNCLISGLIHNYENPSETIIGQGVSAAPVIIGRDTYLGANVVVVAGVTIGEHCVVGAGSIVTHDIPSYTVSVGSPARPVKRYDFEQQAWVKLVNE